MAEEHKKSFMLYFDNFPCVAALDAEQRGELQEAAARRQGDGAISRQALEQAAPKDYSDIRKYLRDVSTAGRLPKSDP